MRLINKKSLILLTSILLLIATAIVIKQTKPVELDEVKLLEASNNTSFAMYKEDGEVYTEVEGNTFPEGYKLNLEKSKCLDNNGNEIKEVLSYDNYQVKLTSNKTTYCYLYFDKTLGVEIKNKNPNKLSTKISGDMYRFQGQQSDDVQNYICFGTSDKQTCKDHPDQYMYRIIGVEARSGRVKVIKMKSLNQRYMWYTDCNTVVDFPNSNIYTALTGDDFLDNQDYLPNDWKSKIADNTWIYGDAIDDDSGAKQIGIDIYEVESGQKATNWYEKVDPTDEGAESITNNKLGTSWYKTHTNEKWYKTFDSKVALMYLHDYYLADSDDTSCTLHGSRLEYCVTSWINIKQNDKETNEWTMSGSGYDILGDEVMAYFIYFDGGAGGVGLNVPLFIRPVFYIDASQSLKDGTGKIDDPFIINE